VLLTGTSLYAVADTPGTEDRLKRFDASAPPALQEVAESALPNHTNDLAIDADLAAVAHAGYRYHPESSGMATVGLPGSSSVAGRWTAGAYAHSLALDGSMAYVATRGELLAVDVSDPPRPLLLGRIGKSGDVAAGHNRVYLASGNLTILDATDPASMTVASQVRVGDDKAAVAIAGNHAFVGGGSPAQAGGPYSGGLMAVDASDLRNPRVIGSRDTWGRVLDVSVRNGTAYTAETRPLGEASEGSLRVYDASAAAQLAELGSAPAGQQAHQIAVEDDLAYVVSAGVLQVFHLEPGPLPAPGGSYAGHEWYAWVSRVAADPALAVTANYVYDSIEPPGSIRALDPTALTEVGHFDHSLGGMPLSPQGLLISDGCVYVADWQQGFLVLELADREMPFRVYLPAVSEN
jgi:hypothetical protein